MKIRTKFIIVSYSGIIFTALILFIFIYFIIISNNEEKAEEHLKDQVANAAKQIDEFMFTRVKDLKVFSNNPLFFVGSIEDISAYLLETVNAYSFYDALVYADTKGVVLASSDNKLPGENILNLYPEIKDEFEKAISGDFQNVYISDMADIPRMKLAGDTQLDIEILSAVADNNRVKHGVLIGFVNTQFIRNILSEIDKYIIGDEYTYLLSNSGDIMITADTKTVLLKPHPDLEIENLKQKIKGGENNCLIYLNSKGRKVISAYADLSEYGSESRGDWSLFSTDSYKDIMGPVYPLFYKIFFIFLSLAILLFLLPVFFSRIITEPLIVLKNFMTNMKNDESDGRIEIKSKDEIGLLADAFNNMKEDLLKSNNEIINAKNYLENILNTMTDMLIIINPDGTIKNINQSVIHLLEYSEDELIGKDLAVLVDDEDFFENFIDQDLKNTEINLLTKSGNEIPVILSPAITDCDIEGVETIVCVARDITERKEAETAQQEQEQLRQKLLNGMLMFVVLIGPNGDVIFANDAALKMGGFTLKDITGKKFYNSPWTAYSDESREMFKNHIKKCATNKNVFQVLQAKTADGTMIWVNFNMHPICDDHGGVKYMIAEGYDVTKYKKTEDAIRESEERYRLIFNSTHDGLILRTLDGIILDINPSYARMHGYSRKELTGMPVINLVHPDYHTDLLTFQQVKSKKPFFVDSINVRKDGTTFPVEMRGKQITYNNQPVLLGIIIDTSERKKAEEERLHLERQIQYAQKLESLGVLAGGIAHDFNNILMAILGNAELALYKLSPMSPVRKNIQEIEKSSMRASDLAKQMLAYSGKGKFIIEPINLNLFINEIKHLLEVSISKTVVIKYNFAKNLPTFDGDTTQINQIIMNLIINASEAIDQKSGIIAVSTGAMYCDRAYLDDVNEFLQAGLNEPLPEGIYTYIEVADTGCGMDHETVEKIFDPFFTTKFTGRGLGMSAVLGIVRGHNGAIKIYTEVGKGTTFKILFPANKQSGSGFNISENDKAIKNDWHGTGTVMIVDDEATVCAIGKEMLENIGFSVITASDGRKALEKFREYSDEIVCVLLDLSMPHMGGAETFREIRQNYPDANVILCSGYNEQSVTEEFVGKGLAGFIQKPYTINMLKKKLKEILHNGLS